MYAIIYKKFSMNGEFVGMKISFHSSKDECKHVLEKAGLHMHAVDLYTNNHGINAYLANESDLARDYAYRVNNMF